MFKSVIPNITKRCLFNNNNKNKNNIDIIEKCIKYYYCTSAFNTTTNARDLFDITRKQLKQAKNLDVAYSSMLDSRILFEHVVGLKENARIPKDLQLTPTQNKDLQEVIERRLNNEPIAYIVGHKYFWKHKFKCNHSTLIPRPDSETLIEQILELHNYEKQLPLNILDLGTGTGCLLLSLLEEFSNSKGVGIDQSLDALKVAKENSISLKMDNRSTFIQSNWVDSIVNQQHNNVPLKYNLIISNPPYISENEYQTLNPTVKQWEPITALVANDNGLREYDIISKSIRKHNLLSQDSNTLSNIPSFLVFEIGHTQEESVKKLVVDNGFEFNYKITCI
ncbi:hypothetical protein DFA_10941 [Cavenderia fasciculata]|uniref:Peptide chain release factor N(5)-glutamine methyltransferase n=1 Tax=Cavenderia fasciculata TaxID=261658 RepID=F4QBU5_CACFS|nr:uncharacterized protein DFA_10941 [Cavenderia fasciculata]EGG14683.1 hypothetical protein DFA_10941 [Cavenderia fasciculata]|eukprot:XP_004351191.1 hypothetical protein DFA_10941 [Cavenderia fasciculata]